MLKLFLKSTIKARSILSDYWVILLISFIFSFVLLFSRSMLETINSLNREFISPDWSIDGKIEGDRGEFYAKIGELKNFDNVLCVDLVSQKIGIVENDKFFSPLALKIVTSEYFNKSRAGKINLDYRHENTDFKNALILSKKFLNKYNLKKGDKLAFLSSDNIRAQLLTIEGEFDTGMNDFDSSIGFLVIDNESFSNLENVSISVLTRSTSLFALFTINNNLNEYSEFELYNKMRLLFPTFSIKEGNIDQSLFRSLGSIKFLLYLFALIGVLYLAVAIKNFINRNIYNLRIYSQLGFGKMKLFLLFAILLTTFLSSISAIILSCLLVCLTPSLLNFLNSYKIVDFGYYITNFKINIFNIDLIVYILINLFFIIVYYLIWILISKNKGKGLKLRDPLP